jgi:hypothetical protein
MPTIGHLIQVDAASDATVFENEIPTQCQMPNKKKARLSRRAGSSLCDPERVASEMISV